MENIISLCRGQPRGVVGGRKSVKRRVSVLCHSNWKSFIYSVAPDARREREDIEIERRFFQLIWETI